MRWEIWRVLLRFCSSCPDALVPFQEEKQRTDEFDFGRLIVHVQGAENSVRCELVSDIFRAGNPASSILPVDLPLDSMPERS